MSIVSYSQNFAFCALTLLARWQEEHLACKKAKFWYCDSDLTGTVHILQFQFAPQPPPSDIAAVKSIIVCHSSTGLPSSPGILATEWGCAYCIASIKLMASVLEDKGRWPELLFAVECGCYNCAVICTVKACHASKLGSVLGVHLCLHFVVPLGCYGFVTCAVHWVEVLKWHNVVSVNIKLLTQMVAL